MRGAPLQLRGCLRGLQAGEGAASVWPRTGAALTWDESRTRAPCRENALSAGLLPSARWEGGGLAETAGVGGPPRLGKRLPSVRLLQLPLAGGLNLWMGWELLCNRTTGSQPRFLGYTGKHGAGEPAERAWTEGPRQQPAPGVS